MNTYWRYFNGRAVVSKNGKRFRENVFADVLEAGAPRMSQGRLAVVIEAYPPDCRIRDLDNLQKATLDALTKAGVWTDDSLIDDLRIIRCGVLPPGRLVVKVKRLS